MIVLTLSSSHRALRCAAWSSASREALWTETLDLSSDDAGHEQTLGVALARVRRIWAERLPGKLPSAVGLRVVFGGDVFDGPTLGTPENLATLELLAPHAPLHVPAAVATVRAARRCFPAPLVLVFETAFFVSLPPREFSYGVSPEVSKHSAVRRYGYHGLVHQAATRELSRRLLRAARGKRRARVLSLCLEPRPELVGVDDGRPVFVTSGATPLEGLPGDTSVGDADPAIVLSLAQSGGLGPESINELLTRQSGLTGLVGEPTTLDRVMRGDSPESRFARSLFEHRLLLAAGAAVAALGGVDGIVLSGRYAGASGALGTFLVDRLRALPGLTSQPIELLTFPVGVDRLVADQVFATALSEPTRARAFI